MTLYHGDVKISGRGTDGSVDITNIADSTNLNDIMTTGFYRCPTSAGTLTLSNCPSAIAFTMLVQGTATFGKQIVTEYTTNEPDTWERTWWNGTWGSWKRVTIHYGTAAPSGGSDGDIYFRYV